jgi:hypothetical protein
LQSPDWILQGCHFSVLSDINDYSCRWWGGLYCAALRQTAVPIYR